MHRVTQQVDGFAIVFSVVHENQVESFKPKELLGPLTAWNDEEDASQYYPTLSLLQQLRLMRQSLASSETDQTQSTHGIDLILSTKLVERRTRRDSSLFADTVRQRNR